MTAKQLLESCIESGITEFIGVPDSTLSEFVFELTQDERCNHTITTNEGSAIAYATGYYLSTGNTPCVYMQNSGLGNAVNPIMSLVNVYDIPMLLIIGHRGAPGVKDEPQHMYMGEATVDMLSLMNMSIYDIDDLHGIPLSNRTALLVKPGTFNTVKPVDESYGQLTRREAIQCIVENAPEKAVFVCTTGKASRELYEIRKERGETTEHDFLNVGAMGHVSMIALGIAKNTERPVICIDGDGSALMHFGNILHIEDVMPHNMKYFVLDNNGHESVGGYQTAVHLPEDFECILHEYEIKDSVLDTSVLTQVIIRNEQVDKLARPSESFIELRDSFVKNLRS